MGTRFQAVLDHWEEVCTRPSKSRTGWTMPAWVLWLSPDLSLRPSETYSFQLYLRMVGRPLLLILTLLVFSYCVGGVAFWRSASARKGLQRILQNPHAIGNAQAITFVYGFAIFLTLVLPLFLALVFFACLFPRYYFWNRRAARMVREEMTSNTLAISIAEDKTTWPPPPTKLPG